MRFAIERRGLLLVLSAPSGGGKSAVLHRLRARDSRVGYSVSYTSRALRGSEVNGTDYHFVTRDKFQEMITAGAFYEWAEVHGNLYGTAAQTIEDALATCNDIALDIDVQGGLNIKSRLPEAVLVFLMPPSMDVLETRLRGRASDCEEAIQLRLANAQREIPHWRDYDYVLINEDLDATVAAVEEILHAERHRAARTEIKRAGEGVN